jgi:hypothetical protein
MAVVISDKLYELICDVLVKSLAVGEDMAEGRGIVMDVPKFRHDAGLAAMALILQYERDNPHKRNEIREMLDKYVYSEDTAS